MTGSSATSPGSRAPLFVITVDTEEDGLWTGHYPATGHTMENLRWLPDLTAVLDWNGCKGTYLVTHPVAVDAASRDLIAAAIEGGRGEVGTHLHPWSCPPMDPVEERLPRYPHCLPAPLQQRKLETLAAAIGEGFGRRPVSYRAGRWGFDASSIAPLAATGHTIDSSIVPGWWQKGPGAPVFTAAPSLPYRPDPGHALRRGQGPLLEIPLTTGFIGPLAGLRPAARLVPTRLPGSRRLMQLAGYTILRPALHGGRELVKLVRSSLAQAHPVLNLMLHSSEIAPGHSPYSRDVSQRDELLRRLGQAIEAALSGRATPATLAEAGDLLGK